MDPSPIDVPEETVVEDLADALTPLETLEDSEESALEESVPQESIEEAPVVAAAEPADKEVEYPPLPAIDEPVAEAVEVATAAVEPFVEPHSTVAEPAEIPAVEPEPDAEPEKDSASSRRRKRQQQKSARARKDKLRSTTSGQKTPPPPAPPPEPARPVNPSGWLVSPQRAAQFEPPVPIHQPAPPPPPPPPVRQAPMPAVPSFVPTPVGAMPPPVYPSQVMTASAYGTSLAQSPPTPRTTRAAAGAILTAAEWSGEDQGRPALGLHAASIGTSGHRACHVLPSVSVRSVWDRSLHPGRRSGSFPWKLAAIAVAVASVAIFVGRTYLPDARLCLASRSTGRSGSRDLTEYHRCPG